MSNYGNNISDYVNSALLPRIRISWVTGADTAVLPPISVPVAELTELLRAHTQQDCSALLATIRRGQETLSRICAG